MIYIYIVVYTYHALYAQVAPPFRAGTPTWRVGRARQRGLTREII